MSPIVGTCSLQNLTAKPCQVTAQRLATCTTNSALQAYGSSSFSIHTSRDPPHGTPSRKAALSGTFALDLHVLGPLENEETIAYRLPMIPFRSPIDSQTIPSRFPMFGRFPPLAKPIAEANPGGRRLLVQFHPWHRAQDEVLLTFAKPLHQQRP